MSHPIRVFKSAVDGKFYKANYTERGRNASLTAGGIVSPSDVEAVEAVTILEQVLGYAWPNYNLRSICRTIQMDNLQERIDIATKSTGQRKVKPMQEAEISKDAFAPINFDLWKNVVHVAVADEAGMKSAHNILQLQTEAAGRDLGRMENLDIKDIAEACTEKTASTPYVDWAAKSSGISTNDPFDAIIPAIDYIQGKGWPVDFMALHQTIYSKFIRNTHVRELVHAGIASLGPNGGAFTLPGYPTVKVVTDFALTETPDGTHGPLIGSSVAPGLVFGEGPTMAAQYRDEAKGFDGYIIRKWQEPKVVIQDAITKICT